MTYFVEVVGIGTFVPGPSQSQRWRQLVAVCHPGDVALSGGYRLPLVTNIFVATTEPVSNYDLPETTGQIESLQGWRVQLQNNHDTNNMPNQWTIWALCADITPETP
ncbi:hypothetical protein BH24CHL1_BH24CHL1_13550 [soil metagenome]